MNDMDYKKFGLSVLNYLDNLFLMGTYGLSLDLIKLITSKMTNVKPPLNWDGNDWPKHYHNESNLLWIMDKNDKKVFLPQAVVIGPWEANDIYDKLSVKLSEPNFAPPAKIEQSLAFYAKKADFNGENARLLGYDKKNQTLTFQGARYFDWVMTNLSLDAERSPLPTLREETSEGNKLQALNDSPLTNITGINGLIFSNDGYMIYQQRLKNVLVRPGQLCSGFSGTVDKIDIEHLIRSKNPILPELDSAREAVEEIGILRSNVNKIIFLGLTRELIRGGTPEMFYAVDLDIDRRTILSLIPKDKEGVVKSVNFGRYARSIDDNGSSILPRDTLWALLSHIESETHAPVSIPFLTNIAMWYWNWAKDKVGASSFKILCSGV
jgi:hypothetical protein